MSNLLKRGSAISKEERIIDYNELIKTKLQNIMDANDKQKADPDGFVNGLTAEVVEELISDSEEDAGQVSDPAQNQEILQNAREEAGKIIEEANRQAESIINDANEQVEESFNQARQQGYQDGLSQADQELQTHINELENQYQSRFEQLESEYIEKKNNVEPELVQVITEVFKSVISSEALDNHDIIMHLISRCLSEADKNQDYVIRVSPDDFDYVSSNQGKISCRVNKDIDIDVVEDQSLSQNQCVIESDGAVFNCSLDVELDNLIKRIRELSCMN